MPERYSSAQAMECAVAAAPASTATAGPASAHTAGPAAADTAAAQLARCLDEIAALPGADAETCSWLRDKLVGAAFSLVVAGQFKRGKSTLINALLGEAVLPTGVVPLTSAVTSIQFGPTPSALVEFDHGEARELSMDALEQYVTERGNPNNVKRVSRVRVRYPCSWLTHDVQLIDTPGIDSVYEHNTAVTRAFIPRADAVIFVASVEQPLSQAELAFLQGVRAYAGKIFCVLNKIDQLSAAELQESIAFCAQCVQDALAAETPIFPVSARLALQRPAEDAATPIASGIGDLQQALQAFMRTDKHAIWRQSVATTLLRMLSQIRFALELERNALSVPLDRLQDALAALQQHKEQARREQVEHSVLLQAYVNTLLRERIEPALAQFKEVQKQRIVELLEQWYRQMRRLSPRQLQRQLKQRLAVQVRATYDGWLEREEPALARAFDQLCGRFWTQMSHDIDQLLGRCGELFGLSFEPVTTTSVWSGDSHFDYRLRSEPTSLLALSASAVLLLPGRLAGPLLLRRLRARALELTETHAGRLRADLQQRLHGSVMDFRNRLISHLDGTVRHIEEAIGRGIERYAAGQADVSVRSTALADLLERVERIETQVRNLAR